ncbi:MAG: DUF1735 domain-containing protein [Pedobacter sp.]|nr:MAG: DUF1735 domain-containing protein [Pedobacter sp.]
MVVLMGCTKEDTQLPLPESGVTIDLPATSDVIEMPVSILKDELTVLEMKAAVTGSSSAEDHHITFAIDTSKINSYVAKYGSALVLPTSAYLFHKPIVKLTAGSTKSEAAQLNIGQQTKLTEYTTYVLPIVIKSIDGIAVESPSNRVIYYVFKTGKPLFVNKTGWTILAFSSQNSATNAATTLLDANNTTTYWTTAITQNMPQYVSINFNKDVAFTAVAYYLPTALVYPTQGGYPTSIQIETSMNGTTWVDRGIYAGNINAATKMQTIELGSTITARYLRFTSLAAVKYTGVYDAVFIAGISLVP